VAHDPASPGSAGDDEIKGRPSSPGRRARDP